jgi:hypothetical protein
VNPIAVTMTEGCDNSGVEMASGLKVSQISLGIFRASVAACVQRESPVNQRTVMRFHQATTLSPDTHLGRG